MLVLGAVAAVGALLLGPGIVLIICGGLTGSWVEALLNVFRGPSLNVLGDCKLSDFDVSHLLCVGWTA